MNPNLPRKYYDPIPVKPPEPPKPKTWRELLYDKLISKSADLVGKTITQIGDTDDSLLLLFSDGTFTQIAPRQCFEDPILEFDTYMRYDRDYLKFGFVTQEMLDEELRTETERSAREKRERDRAQYEQLRRIFADERSDDSVYAG
jgi:hypothetical protein